MRNTVPEVLEKSRKIEGRFASTALSGFNGVFNLTLNRVDLVVIGYDKSEWEYVIIQVMPRKRIKARGANFEEVQYVRNLFWNEKEVVVQYHIPTTQPLVVQLWSTKNEDIPIPPNPAYQGAKVSLDTLISFEGWRHSS